MAATLRTHGRFLVTTATTTAEALAQAVIRAIKAADGLGRLPAYKDLDK
jgi:hypothetical protein